MIVVLCFSVLGVQSFGLFHAVHHANQEQHLQANGVFDSIEKGFSSDPQKSNLVCKLLDSLLLGAYRNDRLSINATNLITVYSQSLTQHAGSTA